MVHTQPITEPYQPHQRAIIFRDDLASGATLGYHCTIIRVRTRSVRRYPNRPDRWVYRVFVPYFNTHMDVVSYDLFVTGVIDTANLPPEPPPKRPAYELRFDSQMAEDNHEIQGAYRSPGREWVRFSFCKCDQPVSDYQLSLQVDGFQIGAGRLGYNVPMTERLDRRFVLRALAEITAVEEWQSS